jgi:hypothetical protein
MKTRSCAGRIGVNLEELNQIVDRGVIMMVRHMAEKDRLRLGGAGLCRRMMAYEESLRGDLCQHHRDFHLTWGNGPVAPHEVVLIWPH